MVFPALPWIAAAAGTLGSHAVTKATEEEKSARKLEATKHILGLSPEAAAVVDAIKHKTADEVEAHAALGIDPRQPLPPQASERAHEVRAAIEEARARGIPPSELIARKVGQLSEDEKESVRRLPPHAQEEAVQKIAGEKAAHVADILAAVQRTERAAAGTPAWMEGYL